MERLSIEVRRTSWADRSESTRDVDVLYRDVCAGHRELYQQLPCRLPSANLHLE